MGSSPPSNRDQAGIRTVGVGAAATEPAGSTAGTVTGDLGSRDGEAVAAAGEPALPARYEELGRLGSGGFGDVRRVRDRELGRVVAMKTLRPDVAVSAALRARFLAEIKLTAGLSHPGIVAVLDHGELPDGRLWFTMPEVRGRTFEQVVQEAFAGPDREVRRRRLLDLFARVCETVAYAHSRGVIHRDLKPANVMIGEFGQVLVMDWGIARGSFEESRPGPLPARDEAGGALTRSGDVMGTPAYMAPEQARGEVHLHGPSTDVYALGALLHTVLAGRPPPAARMSDRSAWADADGSATVAVDLLAGAPAELAAICRRATAAAPLERHPDAAALAAEVTGFLDGARRRERALASFAQAEARGHELAALRARPEAARAEARKALAQVRPSDPVELKLPGWALEDEAEVLERAVALRETEWIQHVHGALAVDATLPEAHAALAAHYRDKLAAAEQTRRRADATRFEVLLRAHDRGEHAAFLRGEGALTLVTEPPGAEVTVFRYATRERRLVAEPCGHLGVTPLRAARLAAGSYLLVLRAPGRAKVRYPVLIERGGHWDGALPGAAGPFPIPLPREGELGVDDVYIPAGPAWTGGDPEAADSLPLRRLWVDGLILRRHPVTGAELLAFLNDPAARRLDNAALGLPSSHPGVLAAALAIPGIRRDDSGRFGPGAEAGDRALSGELPAVVDGQMATAYACWLALRTGQPWRLPDELEREKAARGADARFFPWGDYPEPTFACVLETHLGAPSPEPVGRRPADESPYGARDLAGNSRDWCANLWKHEGPPVPGSRLVLTAGGPDDDDFRVIKGGAWGSSITYSRAAARFGGRPGFFRSFLGVRPARSYP
jgi:formylglycine-generating enzyme required for sulfatase activity